MNFGFLQRDVEKIRKAFKQYPEVEKVILFGSRAKGNYKPGSDVDLAIKGNKVTHSIISAISFLLNEEYALPYYFDVIQYEKITEPKLVEHIDRVGEVIYSVGDVSEWKDKTLGDIVTFQRGHDLSREKFVDGPYPIVGSNGIIGYHNEYTSNANGITIGRSGNIGKPFFIDKKFWAHNTTLYVKKFHNSDPKFIFYLLKTLNLQNINSGSAVPTLNRNYIHPIPVKVPDIYEQKEIAAILSCLDNKINLLRRQNKTLEAIAQALYKHWFVDFEFPDEDGKPYKSSGGKMVSSELGEIPVEFRTSKVGKEIRILGGGTPSTKEPSYWRDGRINWYTPTDLTNNNNLFSLGSGRKITETGLMNSSAKLFPEYSLLMTSRATIGEITINTDKACTNQGFIVLLPSKNYPVYFLHGWLLGQLSTIKRLASGSTFPEMGKSEFKNLDILKVPKEIINIFKNLVEPIYKKIENNIKVIKSLISIRDLLLPKLMSGQIRVKD